jgi:hypothetical protein
VKYQSAHAFRTALERRLLTHSQTTGLDLARLRKLVVFERMLARLLEVAPDHWILKGGLALDFRLGDRARATVDMDLGRHDDEANASIDLVAAQRRDLDDYFAFDIVRTPILDDADVAGTVRYRVRASLAGRRFEEFVVDVGFAMPPPWKPDEIRGPDLLTFADIAPLRIPTIPLPQHLAEKVQAYTRRYGPLQRPSTRVKDLVDLVIMSTTSEFIAGEIRQAIHYTFTERSTQEIPSEFPEPPEDWPARYERLARGLAITKGSNEAHRIVAAFLDPVLSGATEDRARWEPSSQQWTVL